MGEGERDLNPSSLNVSCSGVDDGVDEDDDFEMAEGEGGEGGDGDG